MFRKILIGISLLGLVLIPSGMDVSTAQSASSQQVMLGFYPSLELYRTIGELNDLDTYLGGNKISIAATFLGLESPDNFGDWIVSEELNASWDNGYVPFVNLGSGRSAQEIANGDIDSSIRNWATLFKAWTDGGSKRAFIAPLQEANGCAYDVPYSCYPEEYKKAFLRIQQIFKDEGVPEDTVSWVYAPNGWSAPGDPTFEDYYPGHSAVDVVGFSSFNFGDCHDTGPEYFEDIYKPYLDRMSAMAPGKPIFIAEIGSVTEDGSFDRGAWFQDTLTKIANYDGVRAVLYYDKTEAVSDKPAGNLLCPDLDYRLDANNGEGKDDFKNAVTQSPYTYWGPNSTNMTDIAFQRPQGTFEDVWPASEFSGRTSIYYQDEVETIFAAGLTSGCSSKTYFGSDPNVPDFTFKYFCPNSGVTRREMAVFLENGMHYPSSYSPGDQSPYSFSDTADLAWGADWIEALYKDGITAGCNTDPLRYCPNAAVTREQMAVFLLRSINITPTHEMSDPFNDIDQAEPWAVDFIEELYSQGITAGCGSGNYCPKSVVTRGNMAIFLTRTFNLP